MDPRKSKKSGETEAPEGDPYRGDEILRRMLKTKPKPHKEMAKGRKSVRKLKPDEMTHPHKQTKRGGRNERGGNTKNDDADWALVPLIACTSFFV